MLDGDCDDDGDDGGDHAALRRGGADTVQRPVWRMVVSATCGSEVERRWVESCGRERRERRERSAVDMMGRCRRRDYDHQ